MLGLVLVALSGPAPFADGVCLDDADLFAVPGPVARAMWNLACRHPAARRAEVRAWNRPDVADTWEAECDWRRACWDKLDDVKFCNYTPEHKLQSLRRLRDLLGDEDYFAGRMPMPIPTYR